MVLDKSTRSIVAVLGVAKTTNDGTLVATYEDSFQQKVTPQTLPINTNGTSEVTLVPAPGNNTARLLKEITYCNLDTVTQTITISLKDGATEWVLIKMAVAANRTLQFMDTYGWYLVPNV